MTIYTQPFTYLVGWSEHKTFTMASVSKSGVVPQTFGHLTSLAQSM